MIPCFWYPSQNVGDALNLQLVRWITGRAPILLAKESPKPKFLLCGSILASATDSTIVWGAGVGSMSEPIDPRADIRAVRGPISWWRASKCGAKCPKIWGDPALLLPHFYQPQKLERKAVGIIPHYADQERATVMFRPDEVHFINVLEEPIKVIDEICRCDVVLSSSLHGLIFGAAYNVPVLWLNLDDKLFGDGVKFFDFFESCGVRGEFVDLRRELPPVAELVGQARRLPIPDLHSLWAACPLPVREGLHVL